MCAEILSHVLREVNDIRGIAVHDVEFKVSLNTDDTTLFVDEDLNSVVNITRVLKWFKSISGLNINNEKQGKSRLWHQETLWSRV